ncbi:DUF3221 domain-containing protein [Sporosarcina oncorhynchi]|uniref:DUF3221 domain-containing protein n=1 Tax=Sporosarcina oncorhynchi TaxID=3056444 RepID=A0ABZ0L5I4_9BACL|nr:DUF3221 domain-containing protein [Sporosarcina sp. T2O-4]WOV87832.1 DUF3221 domain-containing protein [Sporosarcina sp. T2O-4]
MKRTLLATALGVALIVSGCGTGAGGTTGTDVGEEDGWKTIKTISGREIIAELKQTVKESPEREKLAAEQVDSEDYKGGLFGDPSPELAEDMAVQAIEGPIALEALGKVYGENGFSEEGVIFFENQRNGAEQSGIWFGVKNPDERLNELLAELQPKVDVGEILAAPIYIFRSAHTEKELNDIQDEVAVALKGMHAKRGSYSLSVDVKSGEIELNHDFLKAEQQKELEEKFPDYTFHFEQDGRLVAEPGDSSIIHPENTFTDIPVNDGGFILSVEAGRIFVAGGNESAIYYSFEEAEKLKVGQRVKVEASGMIMESYPGQGTAKYVEILPDYKPVGAELSESQAFVKAMEKFTAESSGEMDFMVVKEVSFDEKEVKWIFTLDEDRKVEIEDK